MTVNETLQFLNFNENATEEEYKAVYRKIAVECHPDNIKDLDENEKNKEEKLR